MYFLGQKIIPGNLKVHFGSDLDCWTPGKIPFILEAIKIMDKGPRIVCEDLEGDEGFLKCL